MNELPWHCHHCGHEQMVDFDALSSWPLDKVLTAQGFVCSNCGMREAISITSVSLEEALRKLQSVAPGNRKFHFLFAKAIKKAEGLNRRGDPNGALPDPHLAPPRPLG